MSRSFVTRLVVLSASLSFVSGAFAEKSTMGGVTYLPFSVPSDEVTAKALASPIKTIVDKPKPSPTGNQHDYVSFARYWWPDPTKPDGLPWIQKDGVHNEAQVKLGDEPRLMEMDETVFALARAWTKTGDARYAARAGEWLRAWFVTPATRMTPNLEFSQIQMGRNHNHGNGTGVLDGRGFAQVVDALNLLRGSPALSAADDQAVHAWFSAYSTWLEASANAGKEHKAVNNHGSWFLAQAIPIARYVGDEALARQLCEGDKARIDDQIKPDGRQPYELKRQDGLGYSAFNVQAQFQVATHAEELGIDLWHYEAPGGGSLKKAYDYILPYNSNPKSWPGNELNAKKGGFLTGEIETAARVWGGKAS